MGQEEALKRLRGHRSQGNDREHIGKLINWGSLPERVPALLDPGSLSHLPCSETGSAQTITDQKPPGMIYRPPREAWLGKLACLKAYPHTGPQEVISRTRGMCDGVE